MPANILTVTQFIVEAQNVAKSLGSGVKVTLIKVSFMQIHIQFCKFLGRRIGEIWRYFQRWKSVSSSTRAHGFVGERRSGYID